MARSRLLWCRKEDRKAREKGCGKRAEGSSPGLHGWLQALLCVCFKESANANHPAAQRWDKRPEQSQVGEDLMLPLGQLHPHVPPGSLGKHCTQR